MLHNLHNQRRLSSLFLNIALEYRSQLPNIETTAASASNEKQPLWRYYRAVTSGHAMVGFYSFLS